jgi:hypothetical protein
VFSTYAVTFKPGLFLPHFLKYRTG